VRIRRTTRFKADILALAAPDRARVETAVRKLLANPNQPGLRFQKLTGQRTPDGHDIWYFRASRSLRVTCVREGDLLVLRRVGSHDIERTP
jgi:hypothetical protein